MKQKAGKKKYRVTYREESERWGSVDIEAETPDRAKQIIAQGQFKIEWGDDERAETPEPMGMIELDGEGCPIWPMIRL